jgi:hypothetical protein
MVNRRTVLSGLSALPAASIGTVRTGHAASSGDPDISTRAPLDVTESDAVVRGYTHGSADDFDEIGVEYWELGRKDETRTQRLSESAYEIDERPVGGFTEMLHGLDPDTTYVYRAIGKRSWSLFDRTASGERYLLTTPPEDANDPVVEPLEPTGKDGDRATFRAELVDLGNYDSVDLCFQYEPPLTAGITRTVVAARDVTEPRTVETTVEGLNPRSERPYSVTALAVPGDTDRFVYGDGDRIQFETGDPEPITLSSVNVTDLEATTATVAAELDSTGDADAPRLSFEYWQDGKRESTSTTVSAVPPVATGSRRIQATLDGLAPDTGYVVEATADTETVAVETADASFTTPAGTGTRSSETPANATNDSRGPGAGTGVQADFLWWSDVETLGVADVDATGATFRGSIERSADEYRSLGFEYWPTETDGNRDEKVTVEPPSEQGPYETSVESLEPGTEYAVRAYYRVGDPPFVRDETGDEVEFTTTTEDAGGAPVVSAGDVTDVGATRATISGELLDLGAFDRVWVLVTCKNGDTFARGLETVQLDEGVTEPKRYEVPVTGLTPNLGYESQVTAIAVEDGDRVEVDSRTVRFGTEETDRYSVRTRSPTDVTATSATVRATYVDDGDSMAIQQFAGRTDASRATGWTRLHFRYWKAEDSDAERRYWIPDDPILTEGGNVTGTIQGLDPDTTYRVRAVDTLTLQEGDTLEFTTVKRD